MRNTAPCIAYAAFKIYNNNPHANMIIAPSDHLVTNEDEFTRIVKESLKISSKENILITIGIKPSRPDTGYGYIQFNDESLVKNKNLKQVKTFTEKPDQDLALQFIDSGDFLWNSGIFIWNARTIISAFKDKFIARSLFGIIVLAVERLVYTSANLILSFNFFKLLSDFS